ncbi:hypothetical protein ABBQ38_000098 [Trebouxia sp. C0009 RCD-2024]
MHGGPKLDEVPQFILESPPQTALFQMKAIATKTQQQSANNHAYTLPPFRERNLNPEQVAQWRQSAKDKSVAASMRAAKTLFAKTVCHKSEMMTLADNLQLFRTAAEGFVEGVCNCNDEQGVHEGEGTAEDVQKAEHAGSVVTAESTMGVDHISAAAHQPIPTEPSSRDNVDNTDPKKQVADAGDTGVKVVAILPVPAGVDPTTPTEPSDGTTAMQFDTMPGRKSSKKPAGGKKAKNATDTGAKAVLGKSTRTRHNVTAARRDDFVY